MEVMANRWKPDRQNQWFDERLKSALDRYGACQRIPIKARGNTKPHLEAEYTSAPTRHAKPEFKIACIQRGVHTRNSVVYRGY